MILSLPFDLYDLYVKDHDMGDIDSETYKEFFGEITVPTDEEVDNFFK